MKTAIIDAMGWMLLHSLWQAVLLWLFAKILVFVLRNQNAQIRYLIWTGAIFILLFSAFMSFIQHLEMPISSEKVVFLSEKTANFAIEKENISIQYIDIPFLEKLETEMKNISVYFPNLIKIWLLGVLLFNVKYLISYFYIEKNKTKAQYYFI